MGEYTGPERRGEPDEIIHITRGELRDTARRAAQGVGSIHRRRLVLQAFFAALLVAGGIGYYAYQNERDFSRRVAIYECDQLFRPATTALGDFVTSEANLRESQNKAGLGKDLAAGFGKIFKRSTLLKLAKAQQRQVELVIQDWRKDARTLDGLARTNCQARLQ